MLIKMLNYIVQVHIWLVIKNKVIHQLFFLDRKTKSPHITYCASFNFTSDTPRLPWHGWLKHKTNVK